MNRNCYLTGVFYALTILLLSQRVSSTACSTWTSTHYRTYTIQGVDYNCEITIAICRGGCSATSTYKVHVKDDNVDPRSKCSVNAYQCVSVGTNVIEVPLENCLYESNGTAVPETFSAVAYEHEPIDCNCESKISDPISATDCMDTFIYD